METHRNSLPSIRTYLIYTTAIQKRKNIHLTRPHTRLAHIESDLNASMCEAVRELAKELKSDRLIKLYVANDGQPYLISESRLKQASEYFANAIKHENWGVAQDGKLNFPDDDKDAFELMLFYIVEGTLPESLSFAAVATQKVMIETWAIADKYLIRDLQDLIMVMLLFRFDAAEIDWEVVRCAFERTGEGSKLRRLIAEEAMCRTFTGASFTNTNSAEVKELEKAISGIEGALCEVLAMREEYGNRADLAHRLESHETTRPYLYGPFEPESRARWYLEILHRLKG